ncbi:hypothetical protein EV361DRAFT_791474, partial [Lentinula raphanica]
MIDHVRQRYNIPEGVPVDLTAIPDPPDGSRPRETLAQIASLAIVGSPKQMLAIREMYHTIMQHFTWYRTADQEAMKKWQGSLRHLLSLKLGFKQIPRPLMEPGQGNYWTLDVSLSGDKRPRKR